MSDNWDDKAELLMAPIAHDIKRAALVVNLGQTTLWQALKAGTLRAKHHGARVLIEDDELRRFVKALPDYHPSMKLRMGGRPGFGLGRRKVAGKPRNEP